MECLRKLPAARLFASPLFADPAMYSMVVDGMEKNLPASPLQLIAEGRGSVVPLIVGANMHEFQSNCQHGDALTDCPFLQGHMIWPSPRSFIEGMLGRKLGR